MEACVLCLRWENLDVARIVIELVLIYMMNDFTLCERPPKDSLSNDAMLMATT
jgi:hypothetical protein